MDLFISITWIIDAVLTASFDICVAKHNLLNYFYIAGFTLI